MEFKRTIRLEGGTRADDGSSFDFPMVLATQGEASDGHILSIRGGTIPERMPLLVSHVNDPMRTAGSVMAPEKQLRTSPPQLRALGRIELGGSGDGQEFRQDLAHMIEAGHVGAVSIRWNGTKSTPRTSLPKGHPARVDENEQDPGKRYGMYFEEWTALEGSVVAIGADAGAVIGGGRSYAWRDFLELEPEPLPEMNLERAVDLVAMGIEAARELHVSDDEIRTAIHDLLPFGEANPSEEDESGAVIPAAQPIPEETAPARESLEVFTARDLAEMLAANKETLRAEVRDLVHKATGR